jgi:polysaccharide export outer membrane protein
MKLKNSIFVIWGAIILASCAPKTVSYFPDMTDGTILALAESKGVILKPADKISIIINTKSAELNNILNLPVTSQIIGYSEVQSTNQSRGTSGYTIDPEGYIDFPLIGKIKAAGLSRAEFASSLKKTLEEKSVAKDAVVTVEYLDMGFTVIGEVKEPGFYTFDNDKTTLLHALGKAGDMTIYGKRDIVKVIRTNGGVQETYVINMTDGAQMVKSPGYILQSNDVVYVQPNNYRKRQSANANDMTTGSFWISAVSVLTTVLVLIFK